MFQTLGKLVSRTWPLLLVAWLVVLGVLKWNAPPWQSVARDGEFAFLPKNSPSLAGEELFQQGWGVPLASNLVIVVRRESSPTGLLDGDKAFITDVLRERLEKIADEETASLQPQKSGSPQPSRPAEAE